MWDPRGRVVSGHRPGWQQKQDRNPALPSTGGRRSSILWCNLTGSPGNLCFPLALHVIFVDAGAHTISRPGWPLPRRYPLAPRPLPSPGLPPARSLTCCELGGSGLALVGSADRADPHLVQGAWPQGLYRVLAQGRLQLEGGLPTFPTHQAVLQENEIDFGSRWGPLHEGHGVGDISN